MSDQTEIHKYRAMLENLSEQPENLIVLEEIAENGNVDVMYILGWCYFKGKYLPKDYNKSLYWLEKAKIFGNTKAEKLIEQISKVYQRVLILTFIFLIFVAIPYMLVFIGIPIVSSVKAAYLVKDPKNIRDNGCLLYANKETKYGEPMLYLNQQAPATLRQLSINHDDVSKKIASLIKKNEKSGISYDEFRTIHSKECIKVRYIHIKVLWVSDDEIYDLQ